MKVHAAHLTDKPDGPVALLVPKDPRQWQYRKAAQPCPTCGGTGCRHTHITPPFYCGNDCCPDCIDGLPKVELTYPCRAYSHEYHWAHPKDCDGKGNRSAGVGTLTLVPVVTLAKEIEQIGVVTTGVSAWVVRRSPWGSLKWTSIALPPDVKPGDTAAIWTDEQETS